MFEPRSDNVMAEALKEYGWNGEGDPNEFLAEIEARIEAL